MKKHVVVGLGEVLWDVFGDQRHVGGAPFNFAYHAAALGENAIPVSRVGRDALGREIIDIVKGWGLPDEHIQRDSHHPTGTVRVKLSPSGEPTFTITEDVAWDFMSPTPRLLALARRADVVCFGSLCQRGETSRGAIQRFVAAARRATIIFDINLRQRFYSEQIIRSSLHAAHILKLNDGELKVLKVLFGLAGLSDDAFALELICRFRLRMVCVTLGARGCVLRTARRRIEAPGYRVKVADTVGSGDAFTAALACGYLRGYPLGKMADFANRVGAYVASQPGATPTLDLKRIHAMKGTLR